MRGGAQQAHVSQQWPRGHIFFVLVMFLMAR
jgi:hypothetical protein